MDLILTNREEPVDEVKVVGALGNSDHVILDFMILGKTKIVRSHTYRSHTYFRRDLKVFWVESHGQKNLRRWKSKKVGNFSKVKY